MTGKSKKNLKEVTNEIAQPKNLLDLPKEIITQEIAPYLLGGKDSNNLSGERSLANLARVNKRLHEIVEDTPTRHYVSADIYESLFNKNVNSNNENTNRLLLTEVVVDKGVKNNDKDDIELNELKDFKMQDDKEADNTSKDVTLDTVTQTQMKRLKFNEFRQIQNKNLPHEKRIQILEKAKKITPCTWAGTIGCGLFAVSSAATTASLLMDVLGVGTTIGIAVGSFTFGTACMMGCLCYSMSFCDDMPGPNVANIASKITPTQRR